VIAVTGPLAGHQMDESEVYERAVREYSRTHAREATRLQARIKVDHPYTFLAFVGDQHLGDAGTDVARCFSEAELIAATPNMYIVTVGDMLNQFVIGKLRQARDSARISIPDEWALVRQYLKVIAPRLVASVGGNHDYWAAQLIGIDYFQDVLASLAPKALYDSHDLGVTLEVGGHDFAGRIRHIWRGKSIYNITHGIERAAKWDQDFRWAVGGHTHESGLVRGFNLAGQTGVAAMVGSYKRVDPYAKMIGFPKANQSTAVVLYFDGVTGTVQGFDHLPTAVRFATLLAAAT